MVRSAHTPALQNTVQQGQSNPGTFTGPFTLVKDALSVWTGSEVPLHVKRIICEDFMPFNRESKNLLRQGGKTGPIHSLDAASFHLHVRVNAAAC